MRVGRKHVLSNVLSTAILDCDHRNVSMRYSKSVGLSLLQVYENLVSSYKGTSDYMKVSDQ